MTPAAARPNTSTGPSALNVDERLDDNQTLRRGDAEWQVIRTPGHTGPPVTAAARRAVLVVGDALSDDDVGCLDTRTRQT